MRRGAEERPTFHRRARPRLFRRGSPFVDPHPSDLGSTSLPPTRTQIPVSSSGETRALFASTRINDPAAQLGSSSRSGSSSASISWCKLGEGAMGRSGWFGTATWGGAGAQADQSRAILRPRDARNPAVKPGRWGLFSHPNAVAVHDANADGDLAYIEMEYLRGQSLNKVLEARCSQAARLGGPDGRAALCGARGRPRMGSSIAT